MNMKLFLFWFAELVEQFQVQTSKSTKNQLSNFGLTYGAVLYSVGCSFFINRANNNKKISAIAKKYSNYNFGFVLSMI